VKGIKGKEEERGCGGTITNELVQARKKGTGGKTDLRAEGQGVNFGWWRKGSTHKPTKSWGGSRELEGG